MTDNNDLSGKTPADTATIFPAHLIERARRLLEEARERGLRLATAESCTGGLVSGLLTEIPGSSDVVEGGFVTYSNAAKHTSIGVPLDLLALHGAVSEPVALAMAEGVLERLPDADVAVALTGVAGPGGGSAAKPVGLVHLATARRGHPSLHVVYHFADEGRAAIRLRSVAAALDLLERTVTASTTFTA
ncbi:CinA family protein [Pseudochelatococcus sp. B33]